MPALLRRQFLLSASALATLGGCTATGWGGYYGSMADVFRQAMGWEPSKPLDVSAIERLPYASMFVSVGSGRQTVIVLGAAEADDLTWVAADRSIVVTRHGRVVRTVGLANDLAYCSFLDPDPLLAEGGRGTDGSVASRRMVDWSTPPRYGVLVSATMEDLGPETIEIAGRRYDTVHRRETCAAAEVGWQAENHFWQDASTGFVWKSVQMLAPGAAPLNLAVAKPYGA